MLMDLQLRDLGRWHEKQAKLALTVSLKNSVEYST